MGILLKVISMLIRKQPCVGKGVRDRGNDAILNILHVLSSKEWQSRVSL
jgi:hypothetical protein